MAKRTASFLAGKTIAFYGRFSYWPHYHGEPPQSVAKRHGAELRDQVDVLLDVLVIGDKRGKGRAEAKKKAIQIQKRAKRDQVELNLEILDESAFRDLVKVNVTGKRFFFCGGFDCCPSEMSDVLEGMVIQAKGKMAQAIDSKLDFLVVGNRRGQGKTAATRQAETMLSQGGKVSIIDETGFLELVRVEKPTRSRKMDFASFLGNLYAVADERKVQRALKMLQKESFQIFSKANEERVVGVIQSQTGHGTVYSPWIKQQGQYGCSTPELDDCMGLQGSMCKHLLVLLLGLVRTGELDAEKTFQWIKTVGSKRPSSDEQYTAEAFLEYAGAQAGEVDWRPTETVPEDFHSF